MGGKVMCWCTSGWVRASNGGRSGGGGGASAAAQRLLSSREEGRGAGYVPRLCSVLPHYRNPTAAAQITKTPVVSNKEEAAKV